MLIPGKEEVEVLKKNLPTVVIVVLALVVYELATKLLATEEIRITEVKEQRDLYKDAYFRTNDVLQYLIKYENSKANDSTISIGNNTERFPGK